VFAEQKARKIRHRNGRGGRPGWAEMPRFFFFFLNRLIVGPRKPPGHTKPQSGCAVNFVFQMRGENSMISIFQVALKAIALVADGFSPPRGKIAVKQSANNWRSLAGVRGVKAAYDRYIRRCIRTTIAVWTRPFATTRHYSYGNAEQSLRLQGDRGCPLHCTQAGPPRRDRKPSSHLGARFSSGFDVTHRANALARSAARCRPGTASRRLAVVAGMCSTLDAPPRRSTEIRARNWIGPGRKTMRRLTGNGRC